MRISRKYYVVCSMGILFIVLTLLLTTHYILPVYAAESTPSADPLRQSDSEASIKAKLEELKKEIASKAAKLKGEINTRLQNKAYVGNIKIKTQNSLTLATRKGAKIVSINEDSEFESNIKTRKNLILKTLLEEDYVASLGDIDETGVLTARKIILLPASPAPRVDAGAKRGEPPTNYQPKTYFWGQVISISDGLATIKNRDLKNIAISTTQAEIKGDLKTNNFVIITGTMGKNDIFVASFVYVIPQGGILKPKKIATPSAQVSTPSAKPAVKK